jgi:tetratricopeptide (TPR) repeat protein
MHSTSALRAGPARDALTIAIHALDLADAAPPALKMRALADVAHCYRALGALSPAESYLQQALRWSRLTGSADATVDLLCELAELAVQEAAAADEDDEPGAAHRARERARDLAFEASREACHAADPHWEVQVLLRVSEALDRCGDHGDAIALQCRALHLLFHHELPPLSAEPRTEAQAVM